MAAKLAKIFKGDRILWVVLVLLSLVSLVIVFSATGKLAYREANGNTLHYLIRQIGFLTTGFVIMLIMVNGLNLIVYYRLSYFLIGLTIFALIFAFLQFMVSNKPDQETSRSLYLGLFSFQPSELAKISLIIFASRILSLAQKSDEDLKKAFWMVTGVSAGICFIIFLGNVSTAALIFLTIMVLMLIARVPYKFFGLLSGAGIVLLVLLFLTADILPSGFGRVHTFKERILDFVHQSDDKKDFGTTQADYAKLAVFEGGTFGKGPGNSEVSNYMEAGYNDFIYAIFIEEYGFVGGVVLAMLYLILLFRGVAIVKGCERNFPAFLVAGLIVLIVFQAVINMAVSVGAFPVTGQPLPWVSMGGSSMIFTSISFGIILSVSYDNQKNKAVAEKLAVAEVPNEELPAEDEKA